MGYKNTDGRRPIWLMSNNQSFRPELIECSPHSPPFVEFTFAYDREFHKALVDHYNDQLVVEVRGDPDRGMELDSVLCKIHSVNAPLVETPGYVGQFASFGPIVVVVEAKVPAPLN